MIQDPSLLTAEAVKQEYSKIEAALKAAFKDSNGDFTINSDSLHNKMREQINDYLESLKARRGISAYSTATKTNVLVLLKLRGPKHARTYEVHHVFANGQRMRYKRVTGVSWRKAKPLLKRWLDPYVLHYMTSLVPVRPVNRVVIKQTLVPR